MPTMAPRGEPEIRLPAITAVPAPLTTDTLMPRRQSRTTLSVTATSRMNAPQPTMIPATRAFSITLPVTDASASTVMPMPPASSGAVPVGRLGLILRICCPHHREPSALVEIAGDDAEPAHRRCCGDDRALEAELRIDRDLAEVGRGVAGDLDVGSGIASHRRIGGPADAVAAHQDVAGAECVAGVAVLAGTTGDIGNVLDAVVDIVPSSPFADRCTRMPPLPSPRTVLFWIISPAHRAIDRDVRGLAMVCPTRPCSLCSLLPPLP